MSSRPASLLALVLALGGCAVAVGGGPGEDEDPAAAFSPIGRQVVRALRAGHDDHRGETWDLGEHDTLDPGWLIQTPPREHWDRPLAELPVARPCTGEPGCDPELGLVACTTQADCTHGGTCTRVRATVTAPGEAARSLCVGHSDALVDRIYDLIASAEDLVDVSSLTPPDGRFEVAIRNALAFLSRSGRSVRVRYLYGVIPGAALAGQSPEPHDVLARLVRDLAPTSQLRVTVAAYRAGLESWDHAKVIAVDHRVAIVGGHNLLTRHYLQAAPAYDLSMQVTGSAAAHATRFTDLLWRFACRSPGDLVSVAEVATFPDAGTRCEAVFAHAPAPVVTGTTRIISVGRLGTIGDDAADDALVALVDAAQTTLRISQQDIGGIGHQWPEPVVRSLIGAVVRGVDVELVISNIDAYPDRLTGGSASYSNGWTPGDVVHELARYARAHPELVPAGMDVAARLCEKLHAASLRHGADDAWPDGAKFANHAKLIVADDAAFYLGSQNLYPSNLSEYGYIVDDPVATRQLVDEYFAELWSGSQRTSASGADVTCVLTR